MSNFKFKDHDELAEALFELGGKLLVEILPKYLEGELKPTEQDHKKVTFTKMFKKDDGRINWREPARKILNKIRAFNPEPVAWTTWHGKTLNILTAEELISHLDNSAKPGTVTLLQKSVAVKTETCYLHLISVQLEGGREMDAKSFLNGHPDFLSSTLE